MNQFQTLKEKARSELLLNNFEASLNLYKECEGFLSEGFEPREKSIIYLNIAICFINLKRTEEAIKSIDKSIESDVTYIKAYYRKAGLLKALEKYEEALEICQKALKIEQNKEIFLLIKEIKELYVKKLQDRSFKYFKNRLDDAKNEYDYKLIMADIINKYENPEDCLKLLEKNENALIKDMLDYFSIYSKDFAFPIKMLCYFLKKAQEVENDIFLNSELTNLLCNLLRIMNFDHNKENIIKIYPYIQININNIILDIIISQYDNDLEFFWKNISFYLTFFFRNSIYLEKTKGFLTCEEKIHGFYQKILKSTLKQKENMRNSNELMIILLRLLMMRDDEDFLVKEKKLDKIDDDLVFCLECFICLSANFEKSKKYFDHHGIYNRLKKLFVLHFADKEIVEIILNIFTLLVKDKEAISTISNSIEIKNFKETLKSLFHLIGVPNIRLRICLIFLKLYYNRKEKEIVEFNELFDVKLIEQIVLNLSQKSDVLQTVELLSHLTCFDLYKLDLIKKTDSLKILFEHINSEIIEKTKNQNNLDMTIKELDYFNLFLGILHMTFNLCLDKKQEMVDHYKKNYEISDEDFKTFEDMQMKYNKDAYNEGVEYMKYDQKIMKQYGVKTFISKELKIIKFISYFIENFQKNFSIEIKISMMKLLVLLSIEKENIQSLFDIKVLQYISRMKKPEKEDMDFQKLRKLSFEFLSRSLAHCNPKLFTYTDSINFALNLLEALRESGEEIIVFEATLGLIQLTSLGEYVVQTLKGKGIFNSIQNNLLEHNEYIIHSSLELLVNIISQDQETQAKIEKGDFQHLITIVFALYSKYIKEFTDKNDIQFNSPYIETKSILKTLFILFALCSNFKPFKKQLILNKIYDYEETRKILQILNDENYGMEFKNIFKNIIYIWKNSKKRGKELIARMKVDFKQNFKKVFDSSLLKEFE